MDHLLKTKKEFKNSKKRDTNYIYKNEPDKACFQHDMAYGDFKDLARRTASDKFLRDKAFDIAINPKHDGYQEGIFSMVYTFFDKKSALLTDKSAKVGGVNNKIKQNQQLTGKIHKPIIKKYEERRNCSSFKDNIWGAINKKV